MTGPIESINKAFTSEASLRKRIYSAIDSYPEQAGLFTDIGNFILRRDAAHSTSNGTSHIPAASPDEPPSKKRRLEGESDHSNTSQSQISSGPGKLVFEARDISFSLPQRKKLHLGILEHGSAGGKSSFSIQLRNPATNQVESTYSLDSYAYGLRLPVPEKNQKQYNFCLLAAPERATTTEPIIWTVNHGPLKSYKIESPELRTAAPGPDDVLENTLNFCLQRSGIQLTLPSEKEFASAVRESHRKNDVAYHVKAFRGSKEGYLFFLENGIFFGFKKPLSFFSFQEIESISYTSVLQRTFNLNITIRTTAEAETQEIEYSMIDQQDFAGIDTYIKNHQLQDASLAEARRAKKTGKANTNNNNTSTNEANGNDEDADDRTELEKAQAELEDEEDEMEEDYDPDEDEDDDDEGSGSDEDSEVDEKYTRGKGRNLVAEELGSEAEDVEVSEGEEDGEEDEEEEDDDADELQADHNQQQKHSSMPSHPHPQPVAQSQPQPQPQFPQHRNPNAPDLDDEDQL